MDRPKGGKRINIGGEEIVIPNINKRIVYLVILGIVLLIALQSVFYNIGPYEVGVIQRFGKYVFTVGSGLHVKLPFGIDTVKKVKGAQYPFTEEFGYRTVQPGVRSEFSRTGDAQEESLMLTGDLNSAVVEWIVRYHVVEPRDYLFKVRNVQKAIRDAMEAAMRQVVGDRSVDEVILISRTELADEAKQKLQEILNLYNIGITVEMVELQNVNPPEPVKPAFNQVNEARQEKEKMINQAWETYNKAVPKAVGEAEATIRSAEGYALDRVNRAEGDVAKFRAVWQEYKGAKDVTRRRLYLETMAEILPKIEKKYVIDSDQKGILQMLQLQDQKGK